MISCNLRFLLSVSILIATIQACSISDSYCCTDNSQCVAVHGKDTFCTMEDCGQCESPDQPLQLSAINWKDAIVGKPYEVELKATGGFSPYDWVGLSKFGDTDKLTWLVLEKDPDDPGRAYLRNGSSNGLPLLPSIPTGDTEELIIKVTVKDSTRHVDSEAGVEFSHALKIGMCQEPTGCVNPLGYSCNSNEQCLSNFCANGICCQTACDGACEDCSVDGLCNNMPDDDEKCIVDCSQFDSECKKYSNPTSNRCASLGLCNLADENSCTTFTFVPPTVNVWAEPQTIPVEYFTVIKWNSSCANSCAATGGWTSKTGSTGDQITSALVADTDFVLGCTGDGGTGYGNVTVSVKTWADVTEDICGGYNQTCNDFLSGINMSGLNSSAPRVRRWNIGTSSWDYYDNMCFYQIDCKDGYSGVTTICPPDLTISTTSSCTFQCTDGKTISSFRPCGGYSESVLGLLLEIHTQTRR